MIGSVPQTALVRERGRERHVSISELKVGDTVLARAGEKIHVDGTVTGGEASVNEAPISGESLPLDKEISSSVLAGTLVETGALDIRTDRVGKDTTFARIIVSAITRSGIGILACKCLITWRHAVRTRSASADARSAEMVNSRNPRAGGISLATPFIRLKPLQPHMRIVPFLVYAAILALRLRG